MVATCLFVARCLLLLMIVCCCLLVVVRYGLLLCVVACGSLCVVRCHCLLFLDVRSLLWFCRFFFHLLFVIVVCCSL